MSRSRRHRLAQRGQVLVVAALMAVLIFGVLALAVDLGVQTMSQRSMQNISDAGALAGASDLGTNVGSGQQQTAVNDALAAVGQNLGGSWSGGTAPAPAICGSGYCASGTMVSGGNGYTVSVITPPQNALSNSNNGPNDLEVDISTKVQNGFASVIGVPASVVRAHAIAYHWGPPGPYDYTFFSQTQTCSGNQIESIYGDAYIGQGYHPQCNGGGSPGQAALCVYEVGGQFGHVVYGQLPPLYESDPNSYGWSAACSTTGGHAALEAQAAQPSLSSPTNCPSGSTPETNPSTGVVDCVMPNPPVPDVSGPNCQGGPWASTHTAYDQGCVASSCPTIDANSTPGIYVIQAGCQMTLDFSKGSINFIDLELMQGASVNITNKSSKEYMTSYGFGAIAGQDQTADGAITAIGQAVPSQYTYPSGEVLTSADNCVICAPPGTGSPMPIALSNQSTGGGGNSDTLFIGTIFVPGQEISFRTNQSMEDVGQIYAGDWEVQSGNHPNPMVSRDVQDIAYQAEQLRLVE